MVATTLGAQTQIIAEIGVNHNGNVNLARDLIDAAKEAGADFAKFQTFRASDLVTAEARTAGYQEETGFKTQRELLTELELPERDFLDLKSYCENVGIGFLSTAHDTESAKFIFGLGLDFIKVPSGDLTNLPFLERVAQEKTAVILSTGMAELQEIEDALSVLEKEGLPRSLVVVLQCTTNYPTPPSEANLRAMVTIRDELLVNVGFSDHTEGIEASLAAVALGAQIIEKHLTIDKGLPGPDHRASADLDDFKTMVDGIRKVETLLGSSAKRPTESEEHNRLLVRKSLFAGSPIKAGQLFSPDNVVAKRPGTGLSPMTWHNLMGKVASRDFKIDDPITSP